jgi:Tetratricopeptide repeat
LGQMAREHANLRAALAWAFGGGDVVVGMRLVGSLAQFWLEREHWSEGQAWMTAALAIPAPASTSGAGQAAWKAARAAALFWAHGTPGHISTEWETAYHEALALFREIGDMRGVGWTLWQQGRREWEANNLPRATVLAKESLALFRNLGDKHGIAGSLHTLGDVARDQGDLVRATALLEESLALCWEVGFVGEAALVLTGLGDVLCAQGDYPRAIERYWEAVALCQQMGYRESIRWPLRGLGWLALVQGDDGRVRALLQEQVGWLRDRASPTGLAFLLHILGALMNAHGDATQAFALLREGLIQQQLGQQFLVVESLERFVEVVAGQDQPVWAARLLGAAAAFDNATGRDPGQTERAAYAHTMAAVCAQLDEATFAAAWAAGRAMTLEQAVAEALAVGT